MICQTKQKQKERDVFVWVFLNLCYLNFNCMSVNGSN